MFLLTRFSYLLIMCCIAFVSCFLPFWRHTSETCYMPSCWWNWQAVRCNDASYVLYTVP